ncbi:MAG TPA: AGE family epimerase/isomerase [bacterium]|nr:AGE family epimerase/isomerase [bacterium]
MVALPVEQMANASIDNRLVSGYTQYLELRIRFLLDRYRRFPDFPGVQTGYSSISGQEFSAEDCFPYSWINGRGACVFARFADSFPQYRQDLYAFAEQALEALEQHAHKNDGHFPFAANLDGTERDLGCVCPPGYRSCSDLYAAMGFLELGSRRPDAARLRMARQIFADALAALEAQRFVTEPELTPPDRVLENPWSIALDVANEYFKQLHDAQYLAHGAKIVAYLLDCYYLQDHGYYVEYATPDGQPFGDEEGRYIVDPGHAIEFCSFSLEFARLARDHPRYAPLRQRIDRHIPNLLRWNLHHGWNPRHPGIYKTIDGKTVQPVNDTMPWWILPETLLALILAYERTRADDLLEWYQRAHNAYFSTYMNPKTDYGPFQNIAGPTGQPVDIVPACKFQDPEFHSGKNLLSVVQVAQRLGLASA